MSEGGKGSQISDNLRTDETVAKELGIGSRDTYRKEKTIAENRDLISAQDFADWDEGKLSTNKAFQKVKAEHRPHNLRGDLDDQDRLPT